MDQTPDLEKIKEPADLQIDEQPDQKTEAESEELEKPAKAPTAALQAHMSHVEHLKTLNGELEYQKERCIKLEIETTALRTTQDGHHDQIKVLSSRCSAGKTGGSVLFWINIFSAVFSVVGGALLSVAGAIPDKLDQSWRFVLVGTGGSAILFSQLFFVVAQIVCRNNLKEDWQ